MRPVAVRRAHRSPRYGGWPSSRITWPQGTLAAACCHTSGWGYTVAHARMERRLRGENPCMARTAWRRSAERQIVTCVPQDHARSTVRGRTSTSVPRKVHGSSTPPALPPCSFLAGSTARPHPCPMAVASATPAHDTATGTRERSFFPTSSTRVPRPRVPIPRQFHAPGRPFHGRCG